jgi:hypothetical protein
MAPPGAPEPVVRPARPWTVTAAGAVLVAAAVSMLALVPALGWDLVHFDAALAEAARRTEASADDMSSLRLTNTVTDLMVVAGALAGAAVLVLAVRWTRTGRYRAWVVTGVVAAGTGLCCSAIAIVSLLLGDTPSSSALFDQAQEIQSHAAPGWVNALEAVPLATPVLCFGAVILMALPPSSRYFRPGLLGGPLTFDAGPDGIWVARPDGTSQK